MGRTWTEEAVRKKREFVVVFCLVVFCLFVCFGLFETGLLYITTALAVLEIAW